MKQKTWNTKQEVCVFNKNRKYCFEKHDRQKQLFQETSLSKTNKFVVKSSVSQKKVLCFCSTHMNVLFCISCFMFFDVCVCLSFVYIIWFVASFQGEYCICSVDNFHTFMRKVRLITEFVGERDLFTNW